MSGLRRTKLTKTIIDTLASERERTGVTYAQLLKRSERAPHDLSERHIYIWLNKSKTARSDHLQFVLDSYKALPTLPVADPSVRALKPNLGQTPTKRALSPFVEITDDMRAAMQSELTRSGIRQTSLKAAISPDFDQISLQMLRGWINGSITKARREYWDYVMKLLRQFPDRNSGLNG